MSNFERPKFAIRFELHLPRLVKTKDISDNFKGPERLCDSILNRSSRMAAKSGPFPSLKASSREPEKISVCLSLSDDVHFRARVLTRQGWSCDAVGSQA